MNIDVNAPEFKSAVKDAAQALFDEQAGGLKAKNDELLGEVKDLKKKFEGIDPDEFKRLKKEKRKGADDDSTPEQLRQRIEEEFAPKLTAAEERAGKAEKRLNDLVIDRELSNALGEVGVAKEFLRAVKSDLASSRKVEVVEDKVLIDGKPASDFAKTWATTDGKAFIAAPNNNGGGGNGGNGGGAPTGKKHSEMSLGEKTAFINEHGDKAWKEKIESENKG